MFFSSSNWSMEKCVTSSSACGPTMVSVHWLMQPLPLRPRPKFRNALRHSMRGNRHAMISMRIASRLSGSGMTSSNHSLGFHTPFGAFSSANSGSGGMMTCPVSSVGSVMPANFPMKWSSRV